MVTCKQIYSVLQHALQRAEVEDEAIRQFARMNRNTREVHARLKQYLSGERVEVGLSIIAETGYGNDEYVFEAIHSVLQRREVSDGAKMAAADIIASRAGGLNRFHREKWSDLLRSIFSQSDNNKTQEAIVRAVRALRYSDVETTQFFVSIIDRDVFPNNVKIQAAMGLADLGYNRLAGLYLSQVARESSMPYRLEALREMIVFDRWRKPYVNEAINILADMLANYREFASYLCEIMRCVDYLEQKDFDILVPYLRGILENEKDCNITWPVIDALVWRIWNNQLRDICVTHLREWLQRRDQPLLQTRALIYLIRLGVITDQDLNLVGASIEWEKMTEELLRFHAPSIPHAIRNRLVELSRVSQHLACLLARVYLDGFDQADFHLVKEMLGSPDVDTKTKRMLLRVLAEAWYQMGCHQQR